MVGPPLSLEWQGFAGVTRFCGGDRVSRGWQGFAGVTGFCWSGKVSRGWQTLWEQALCGSSVFWGKTEQMEVKKSNLVLAKAGNSQYNVTKSQKFRGIIYLTPLSIHQFFCGYCNSVKGSRPMAYLMAKLKVAWLQGFKYIILKISGYDPYK